MLQFKISVAFVSIILINGCGGDGLPVDPELRNYSDTFSAIPEQTLYPEDNPYSVEKETLGELLFWDPIISGNQNVSCASCHHPSFGWADGRRFSVGSDGIGLGPNRGGAQVTPLHSPTILNVAYSGLRDTNATDSFVSGPYFWDLRADTLEDQAIGPIKSGVEMRGFNVSEGQIINEIVMRLQAIPEYVELFNDAYSTSEPITEENIAKALATFQRKIISQRTRFDDFLLGNETALSEQEIIGLNKFIDGGCARCHSGPMLSDNQIHEGESIVGNTVVRTPTLRGLNVTAPFMHDGSSPTLIDAIEIYEDRGDIQVTIGDGDFRDIEIFLSTLNANQFYQEIPSRVPSGLKVGGDID